MDARLKQAEEIFHEVSDAAPEAQERILRERCGADTELRALVERLLAHDREGMGQFLAGPTLTDVEASKTPSLPPPIGPYTLLELLGSGGMGTVYLARQTKPMERDVALKVIRAGLDSKEIVARFEAERQALALMDHPNIARALDGGETDQSQPYFVMEWIRGTPITDYCDRHRLPIAERLDLFRRVCDAVQHAHQKGVIHRDLKPSNVLVTEVDGKPAPKVIDFGVAKAVGRRLANRTMHTEPGVLVGTVEYMSPEHADPDHLDLDTRADVYSLGVILYELLVGSRPFEEGSTLSLLRRIQEEEPRRPSTRIGPSNDRSGELAWRRGTQPTALRRLLRQDLDWIVLKAIEKERNRRYASPAELAKDLQRYLDGDSVAARPPTAVYLARKFVRRHRVGVTAAALVVLTLVGAVVGTSMALVRARRAEARARMEQQHSQRAADFLAGTLRGIDPAPIAYGLAAALRKASGTKPTDRSTDSLAAMMDPRVGGLNLIDVVRDQINAHVLDRATRRIEMQLKGEPVLAADLYRAIWPAYAESGKRVQGARRAVELTERSRGRNDPVTVNARIALAREYAGAGRTSEALTYLRKTADDSRRALGEDAAPTVSAMANIGSLLEEWGREKWTLENRPEPVRLRTTVEAESLMRRALAWCLRVQGPDNRGTINTVQALAAILRDEGRYAEAESLARDNIARVTRLQGPNADDLFGLKTNLASILYYGGRIDEALRLADEVLDGERRRFGDDSQGVLILELKFAEEYVRTGRFDEAEPLLRHCVRAMPLVFGDQSGSALEAVQTMARLNRLKAAAKPR